ncbi:MAG: hypothetical protein ABIH72_04850 [archaeon]
MSEVDVNHREIDRKTLEKLAENLASDFIKVAGKIQEKRVLRLHNATPEILESLKKDVINYFGERGVSDRYSVTTNGDISEATYSVDVDYFIRRL